MSRRAGLADHFICLCPPMGSTHHPAVLLPGGPVVPSRSSRASSSVLPLVWGPRPGSGVFGPAAARPYLARSQHKDSRGEAPATGAARDPPRAPSEEVRSVQPTSTGPRWRWFRKAGGAAPPDRPPAAVAAPPRSPLRREPRAGLLALLRLLWGREF